MVHWIAWVLAKLAGFVTSKVIGSSWKKLKHRVLGPPIRLELPAPVNPIGRRGGPGGQIPGWSLKLRLITSIGDPVDVVELRVHEDRVGDWEISEIFRPDPAATPITLPIRVDGAVEFNIRAWSPRTFQALPIDIGKLALEMRDSTQAAGKYYRFPLTNEVSRLAH